MRDAVLSMDDSKFSTTQMKSIIEYVEVTVCYFYSCACYCYCARLLLLLVLLRFLRPPRHFYHYHYHYYYYYNSRTNSPPRYLPTPEECAVIRAYTGDPSMLGEAEKFMKAMMEVPNSVPRLECLIFKKDFQERLAETAASVALLDAACAEVKESSKLKRLLQIVLHLGNKLNEGREEAHGFSLDALLKLDEAKAFDKKTSIMQCVTPRRYYCHAPLRRRAPAPTPAATHSFSLLSFLGTSSAW